MKFPRLLILAALLLSACNAPTQPAPTPGAQTPTAAVTAPSASPVPSPTPVPARTLVVCLSEEPQTLYLYGASSRSMWNVLEAVYDGPFDTRSYDVQPVILEKMPSLADGSAVIQAVDVSAGSPVVDMNGTLVGLAKGVSVLPSGCSSADCALTWDGVKPLKMDQLSATFTLKKGIQWSDGSPLSAADSVFSYQIAADPATPTSKTVIDRTASYRMLDDQNVVWTGVPGFVEQHYPTYFFTPLPKHALQGKSAADLLADPTAGRSPLGWGPYILEEWTAGDHITFKKNPAYFRAAEGLPKFDHLVYRFLGNPADSAHSAVISGECDIVDQNPGFQPELASLMTDQNNKKLKLLIQQGPEWEQLDFGIRPASYDGGFDPSADRPDWFGDMRTRQAVAGCIDRAKLNQDFFQGKSAVPAGYLPPNHPLFQKDLQPVAYDPAAAGKLLDAAGWKLSGTERKASGVKGVPEGSALAFTLITTDASLRKNVVGQIASDLKACGISLTVNVLNPADLYAPGPDGLLFGRKFDLAEFFWEAGTRPACLLYTSAQIPSAANHWIGTNPGGFSNPAFDAACVGALWARPDQPDYAARIQAAEKEFAQQLPALPLFYQLHLAITRPDLCGLSLDPTARSLLSTLEQIDYGKGCQ